MSTSPPKEERGLLNTSRQDTCSVASECLPAHVTSGRGKVVNVEWPKHCTPHVHSPLCFFNKVYCTHLSFQKSNDDRSLPREAVLPCPTRGGSYSSNELSSKQTGVVCTSLARMRSETLGVQYDYKGLQASVCPKTSPLQWHSAFSCRGKHQTCSRAGNCFSVGQRCDPSGSAGSESAGLLLPLLPNSKERWSATTYLEFKGVKRISEKIHVQNVDLQCSVTFNSGK